MKKVLTIAAVVAALALTGCASSADLDSVDEDTGNSSSSLYERTVDLSDGRTVTCVIYDDYRMGGVSCDWGNAS